jgi:hypothetical protein
METQIMSDRAPLTIEIVGLEEGRPVVLDRVIGGTVYLDEAKQIGQRLLSIIDTKKTRPEGYRVLTPDHEVVYVWHDTDN